MGKTDFPDRKDQTRGINPSSALYIKLGSGGRYEHECIEVNQTLWLGHQNVPHDLCQDGEWDKAKAVLIQ
ncbi:MAG: hypothetical protein Kow0063_14570 [Anaerolineae bacterium]